jgi:hypothetical protein
MRRWLLTFLLCVLPIQFVWAAGAPYCAHERDRGARQHFGHHEHQHVASAGSLLDEGDQRVGGAQHVDCEACHFGCSMTLPSSEVAIGTVPAQPVIAKADPPDTSHIPSGPERPDRAERTAAARFGGGVANARSIA